MITGHYSLVTEQWLPNPLEEVFSFFSRAENLEVITPDFLRFKILSPTPIQMARGTLIDYRLKLAGIPFRWQSRIDEWVPGRRFVDVQTRGPYKSWHHTHEFEDVDGGTLIRDTVKYSLSLGPLGRIAHALFVRRSLFRIFNHRKEVIAGVFA
jgi:ligand-binding SRPBCC domain-containing protein